MDISSLLEVEVKEGKPSELRANGEIAAYKNIPDFSIRVSPVDGTVSCNRKIPTTISHDEQHFYKLTFGSDIASVRFRKLHCTACDIHIGSAPSQAHNMHEHPELHVLLCTNCRNFYGDGTFEQGDDATDMFCRWCANGGNLYCCSYCSNTFCYACIKRNFDPLVRKKIERDEKWKCFVCNPADLYSARASCWALLQHVQTVTRILQTDRKMSPEEIEAKMNLDESQCCPHKRKRSDTQSDDEDVDETYTMPKRKRRKVLNARRAKRRLIKLEMTDGTSESAVADPGPRQPNSKIRVANDEGCFVQSPGNHSESHSGNDQSPEDVPLSTRKKTRRLRSASSNRSTDTERSQSFTHDDDIPPPLLQCDQTMIEGAESLSFGAASPSTRGVPSSTPKPGITPVPTANLLKRPVGGPATRGGRDHRIVRSVGGPPLLVRKLPHLLPNISQSSNNVKTGNLQPLPMVSIPSRNHVAQSANRINVLQPSLQPAALVRNPAGGFLKQIRPHIVLAQPIPNPNIANRTPTIEPPSVINLDSDDDETVNDGETSKERGNSHESNDRVPELSTATYPVRPDDGFMTILSSTERNSNEKSVERDENEAEDERWSKQSFDSFMRAIRGSMEPMDDVLEDLNSEMKNLLRWAVILVPEKEWITAKAKTKAINRTIERTIADLRSINDSVESAYHAYRGKFTRDAIDHTPLITLKNKEKSNKIISLDMQCTRDSEPESEDGASDDDSEDSQDTGPSREMRPYRWRVSRAVEAKPTTENKSVQAYDVVTTDCEKSIGYALLLKADYDSKRERDILKPVMVPDENFGKYEEEFISYLQYIEDRRNVADVTTSDDSALASITDLVDADISVARRISDATSSKESSEKMDVDDKRTNVDDNVEILDEHLEISITTNSVQCSNSESNAVFSDSATENFETTSSRTVRSGNATRVTDTVKKTTPEAEVLTVESNENMEVTTSGGETSEERTRRAADETVLAVRALVDENKSENGDAAPQSCQTVESDDECTVLD